MKSLQDVDRFYYDSLEEFTALNFKKIKINSVKTIWQELLDIQTLRNKILHEGVAVEKCDAQNVIDIASYVYDEIIPIVLDKFYSHLEDNTIKDGTRETALHRAANLARKQAEKLNS
jgi:hypothetical protein